MEYIDKNPGCTINDVAKGVVNYISRKPASRIVHELIKEGAVLDEIDKNVRGKKYHKLFVNTTSLLVSVPKDLDEFKNCYLMFVKKTIRKIQKKKITPWEEREALAGVIKIMNLFTAAYLLRSTIIWPQKIQNKDTLNRLNADMLAKLVEIQSDLFQTFKPSGLFPIVDMITQACSRAQFYSQYDSIFEKFDINKKEVRRVIDKIHIEQLYGCGSPDGKLNPS